MVGCYGGVHVVYKVYIQARRWMDYEQSYLPLLMPAWSRGSAFTRLNIHGECRASNVSRYLGSTIVK